MKKWKQVIMTLAVVMGMAVAALPTSSVAAINVFSGCSGGSSTVCKASGTDNISTFIKNIINTALLILGMVAVLMIVIGGIRYTTSNGDSSQLKGAKDTIMYAVVGLIVAAMSFTIVNFVLSRF